MKRTDSFEVKIDEKQNQQHEVRHEKNPTNRSQVVNDSVITLKRTGERKLPISIRRRMKESNKQSVRNVNFGLLLNSKIRAVEGKMFVCGICQADIDNEFKVRIANCEHYFCNSCMQHYALYKIQRFEEVICPEQECDLPMDMKGDFFSGLPLQAKAKAKKIMAFYSTLKNSNLRLCPNNDCEHGVVSLEGTQQTVTCDQCSKQYCKKCMFPSHQGDCDKNEVQFFEKNLRYRQCVQCKMVIERSEGCRRMKCRCGYQFCYVCGIKWPGYQHTHTAEEEFGVDGNLNGGINLQPPPPPPPPAPVEFPHGIDCFCYILKIVFLSFPLFLIILSLRTVVQLIVIAFSLYGAIWTGLCGVSCRIAEQCECPCPVFVIFFPFFLIAGVFLSLHSFLTQRMCELMNWYFQSVCQLAQCLFRP